ncbi:MAG: hypothetical protein GC136_09655 [Alphaproteobacteria bacterium]|nr:hypothetical protein [Alphaproteobacteria bacterium]
MKISPLAKALRQAASEIAIPLYERARAGDMAALGVEEKRPDVDYMKDKKNLVTQADREIEHFFAARMQELAPGGSVFLGEESVADVYKDVAQRLEGQDQILCVDGIDGTTAFVNGTDEFTIICFRTLRNEVVEAAIYRPMTREMIYGTKEGGVNYMRFADDDFNSVPDFVTKVSFEGAEAASITSTHKIDASGIVVRPAKNPGNLASLRNTFTQAVGHRYSGWDFFQLLRSHAENVEQPRELETSFIIFDEGSSPPWDVGAGVALTRWAGGYDYLPQHGFDVRYDHHVTQPQLVVVTSKALAGQIYNFTQHNLVK